MDAREGSFVFNVVWTGTSFEGLQYFVSSQLAQSRARFRFVVNGCPPEQVAALEAYRARHPHRVVEVLDVSTEMIAHGQALDLVREVRDDGEWFCLIDPDIKVNAPFVGDLAAVLDDADVVTSGKEVWSTTNVLPEGYWGVAGEYFYDRDGFVFGSPHLAIYRRSVLDEVCERWDVGMGSAGPELSDAARAHLAGIGREFKVYDTAKIVNCLLQADGHRLVHREFDQLVHIGGLAHYLSPAFYLTDEQGEEVPEWTRWDNMGDRHRVARFTAQVLRGQLAGEPVPAIPPGLDPSMEERLALARDEVVDLIARYRHGPGPEAGDGSAPAAAQAPAPGGDRRRGWRRFLGR